MIAPHPVHQGSAILKGNAACGTQLITCWHRLFQQGSKASCSQYPTSGECNLQHEG